MTGRGFDRLVNFTDAVVAIAITVLVLPLTPLTQLPEDGTVWDLISEHSGQVSSFVFTFFVIAMMWGVHNRVVNRMRGYDTTIFWLNLGWIATIVFMTWPAALYGETIGFAAGPSRGMSGGEGLGGVGLFYWVTLACVSGFGTLMARHVRRHPELVEPRYRSIREDWRARWRGVAFMAYCLLTGVVSMFAPVAASWMPLGLIVLSSAFPSAGMADGSPREAADAK